MTSQEFLELEFRDLNRYKVSISDFILNTFIRTSYINITRLAYNIQKALYDTGKAMNGHRLNSETANWLVSIYADKKNTPNHFRISIHNGSDHWNIGSYHLDFYIIPFEYTNDGYVESYYEVDAKQFKLACDKYIANNNPNESAYIQYKQALDNCENFIDDIKNRLKAARDSKKWADYCDCITNIFAENTNIKPKLITSKVPISTVNQFISFDFSDIIDKAITLEHCKIHNQNMFKGIILAILKQMDIATSTKHIRQRLLKQLETNGIEKLVESIGVNSNIDLSEKNTEDDLKHLLDHENIEISYEKIIENYGNGIISAEKLETYLLQLVKLYYDFTHLIEKNKDYLSNLLKQLNITKSKFIYDICDEFSEKVNDLWLLMPDDRKKDYADKIPRDSIYRCQKTAYIRPGIYQDQDPETGKWIKSPSNATYGQDLLNKMKAIMAVYNERGDTSTIIIDIEMDDSKGKNGFLFDFITYKENESDEVNGRRLSLFTEMFNRAFSPDVVLYLTYDNN